MYLSLVFMGLQILRCSCISSNVYSTSKRDLEEKVVFASKIWNKEQMHNMLGIKSTDEVSLIREDIGASPSLMTALRQSAQYGNSPHLPTVCRLPGFNGNVARTIRNQGDLSFCHTHNYSILKARFNLKNSLPLHENITKAEVKIRIMNEHSTNTSVFRGQKIRVKVIGFKIPTGETKLSPKTCVKLNSSQMERLMADKFGKPTFCSEHELLHTDVVNIEITQLVANYQKRRMGEFTSLILIENLADVVIEKTQISLFVVSMDRRRCPLTLESKKVKLLKQESGITNTHSASVLLERATRDLSTHNPQDDAINTKNGNIKQSKRSATRSSICKEHPMWVSFEDMEWGKWIIAPRGFHAKICQGECPFPLGDKLNATNHAVLMTLMNSVEPNEVPLPCCVPTHLTPISLLFFDTGGNVVLRQYEDMVVQSCGCR